MVVGSCVQFGPENFGETEHLFVRSSLYFGEAIYFQIRRCNGWNGDFFYAMRHLIHGLVELAFLQNPWLQFRRTIIDAVEHDDIQLRQLGDSAHDIGFSEPRSCGAGFCFGDHELVHVFAGDFSSEQWRDGAGDSWLAEVATHFETAVDLRNNGCFDYARVRESA